MDGSGFNVCGSRVQDGRVHGSGSMVGGCTVQGDGNQGLIHEWIQGLKSGGGDSGSVD